MITKARKSRGAGKLAPIAPIDASTIDVLGKAQAAKRLVAFAAQEGAASLPLLEKALTSGSRPVRAAAAQALAVVDAPRGEALAHAALDQLLAQKKPRPRDVKERLRDLVAQRTTFAIERALELLLERGIAIVALDEDTQRILVPALVTRVGARSLEDAAASFDATQDLASAHAFVVRVLDDEKRPLRDRREAAAALAAFGDVASLDALLARASPSTELPALASTTQLPAPALAPTHAVHGQEQRAVVFDLALRVLLRIDPAVAYDKLSTRFKNDARARATIADEIGPRADKRWRTLALVMLVLDPRHSLLVLARIGAVDDVLVVARRKELDPLVRHALHALGAVHDARAVAVALDWLARDEGETHAPTLLAALAECASLDDIPRIEALVVRAERADFYTSCIDRVRTRASALT